MEHFEKMLVLSTGHMPNTSPRFGDYRIIKFEHGYVVWVSEDWRAAEDWFKRIMAYAYTNDCTMILFDSAEAPDGELFPVYEW